jgi:hypothetical protein
VESNSETRDANFLLQSRKIMDLPVDIATFIPDYSLCSFPFYTGRQRETERGEYYRRDKITLFQFFFASFGVALCFQATRKLGEK